MRVALAGKGGSGKTTISATLARSLARQGHLVNAIDDDPNPNLAQALGLGPEGVARLRRVPREEILEERADPVGQRTHYLKCPFEEILQTYGVRGPDGVGVLMMTGLVGAGKG